MVLTLLMLLVSLMMLIYLDEREDYREDRYIDIGLLDEQVVVVVYTDPDEGKVRI